MERLTIYEIPFPEFADQIRSIVKAAIADELRQLQVPNSNTNSPPALETYSTQQVCTLLGITPPTLIKYRKQGKIKAKQMGGKNIYLRSEVERFIRSR